MDFQNLLMKVFGNRSAVRAPTPAPAPPPPPIIQQPGYRLPVAIEGTTDPTKLSVTRTYRNGKITSERIWGPDSRVSPEDAAKMNDMIRLVVGLQLQAGVPPADFSVFNSEGKLVPYTGSE